jgi:hypothetical protein
MAKDKKDKGPPTGGTPFQKFERLAKALVAAPKEANTRKETSQQE